MGASVMSLRRRTLTFAAMAFIMLLTVGVSIPANAVNSDPNADGAARGRVGIQTLSVGERVAEGNAAPDTFSATAKVVAAQIVSSAGLSSTGEPSTSGVTFIAAPGPVLWPTDVSPRIGHGVSNSHHGQDLLVAQGTPVHAIADGTVVVSTTEGSYGQYVVIQSTIAGHIVTSLYAHLEIGSPTFAVGQPVAQGQTIGLVGSSGAATGYLLYLRILQDGALCDTITYIAGNPAGGATPH